MADARFNLRLSPALWPGQRLVDQRLSVTPNPARLGTSSGPYLTKTSHMEFDADLAQLDVLSEFSVETSPQLTPGEGPPGQQLRAKALRSGDLSASSPVPYLFPSRIAAGVAEIGQWAQQCVDLEAGIVHSGLQLAAAIHGEFAYRPGVTTSATPPQEAFVQRQGVCQDFAHIMIIGLRWLGIPASYASGYLRTVPPPGKARLIGADAMHAWVNIWCGDDLGWIGFDPTNNCLAGDGYIQIGMGRDYADVAPIDGIFIGAAPQSLASSVNVEAAD